ncbi:keratin-associated protein 13-1-like [Dipodomys spectabilis]|uniref:keratin-associated protein 13-1-like n=1 Tax=Dipodomys spectabilis TaxID=105255 RepID=UPI001C539A08|nr:keratin-associated protein 13-1-like [Dipodomys spectabilis]
MSYSCCPGTFSSSNVGDHLQYSGGSYGSSLQSNLFHSTSVCSPRPCLQASSLQGACQETFHQPTRCQTSYVASRPCHTSCHRPSVSTCYSPGQSTFTGSLGFGSSSCHSQGYASGSSQVLSCGSSGIRPQIIASQGYGSGFCRPAYLPARPCQPSCYRPSCGSGSGFC